MSETHSNNEYEMITETIIRNSASAGEKNKVKRENNPEDYVACQADYHSSKAGHEEPQELFRIHKPVEKQKYALSNVYKEQHD